MEKNYHISKGAKDHFYILNNGSAFIKTLSIDLDVAKNLAKKIVGKDVPVDIWNRTVLWKSDYTPQHDAHVRSHEVFLYQEEQNKLKAISDARQYVGEVGDILTIELEKIASFGFETEYGCCLCFKFKDANDNRYIYFGTSKKVIDAFQNVGDKKNVTFEIKKLYRDQYQSDDNNFQHKTNQITKLKIN